MVKTQLRLPDELHKALQQAAAVDRRSLNGQIVYLLAEALGQRD